MKKMNKVSRPKISKRPDAASAPASGAVVPAAKATSVQWVAISELAREQSQEAVPAKRNQGLAARWGADLVAPGWVALPSIILEKQSALGLEPLDVNIILQIVKHWRTKDNLPHPSKARIAKAIGVTPRTVQRRITALVGAGLVRRIERTSPKGNLSTAYDFSGLIEHAKPYAKEAMEERQRYRDAEEARLRRKKPKLVEKEGA